MLISVDFNLSRQNHISPKKENSKKKKPLNSRKWIFESFYSRLSSVKNPMTLILMAVDKTHQKAISREKCVEQKFINFDAVSFKLIVQ